MEKKIWYHRLMLYQNLMTSDNERLGKIVIESQQEQNGNNWYSYTVKIAGKLGIQLEWIDTMAKAKFMKEVKKRIEERIGKEMREKEEKYKKMRHQIEQGFGRKKYLMEMGIKEASDTIRRRLEMIDIGNNLGKNRKCKKCNTKETIEHMIECRRSGLEKNKIIKEWLKETEDITIIKKINE